ncbi:MAG: DUF131 domain-containing protein [Nitrososphaerota archaeon]|nr:DUF131 domain-containing protein [Nitrososphaerota archaeon]
MDLGSLLIIIGSIVLLIGIISGLGKSADAHVKGGGIVLIGPLPIVFGSEWKIVVVLMAMAILIMLLWFALLR